MFNKSVEKTIAHFLRLGLSFTTLFIVWGSVTDPVNITKLFAAGCVGFAVFSIALVFGSREMWRTSRAMIVITVLFIVSMLNAVINSDTALTQNIYGVFGRQTGFVTYLILALIALSATLLRSKKSFDSIIAALLFSGFVNVVYCAWVLVFGDFIGWTNPYKAILGLFGNPDFISAFLGIFITVAVATLMRSIQTIYQTLKNKNRNSSSNLPLIYSAISIPVFGLLSLVALYEIKRSLAIQGLVVTAAGLAIVGFYVVRGLTKSSILSFIYVGAVGIISGFALAGALQKGPLASLIYKTSVSLRGQYWQAGINMGTSNPLTGVGLDSYGNYYRLDRTEYAATVLPGPKTITNVAHNVVVDFFASGGYPLLITYLALILLGIIAIVKVTLRNRNYDGTFVALVSAWTTYQLQSIISINQVGLAIWGWVLTGGLVAYEYATRSRAEEPAKRKMVRSNEHIFSPQLVGGVGLVIGALIAVPPLSADSKWRTAVKSQNALQVETALTNSYLTPQDSYRYIEAVQLFERSKLYDLSYKYALKGIEFNPDYFDAWKMLYSISKSTPADKERALANMKRLDPKNPDVLAQ